MPRWIPITLANLKVAKLSALVEALRTAALGDGQEDPTDEIIEGVIARIRAEIEGCDSNVLDEDETTIPKDLKPLACRMVIREMKDRLEEPLTAQEQTAEKNDLAYLERIAACKVPIAAPDNPQSESEVQGGGGITHVTADGSRTSREKMNGL